MAKQANDITAGSVTQTEHETKALHFRIVRFMFECGMLSVLISIVLSKTETETTEKRKCYLQCTTPLTLHAEAIFSVTNQLAVS